MIVVLIIGILLAIAVPSFMNARERSRANACRSNLRQIQAAKEQWAMANNQGPTATPGWADLVPDFMQQQPNCPSGGNLHHRQPEHPTRLVASPGIRCKHELCSLHCQPQQPLAAGFIFLWRASHFGYRRKRRVSKTRILACAVGRA
jgi:competence protein ComGC